jgi:hypothetical protein
MASVVISGDTSGTATLQAQGVAGNTVLTLPTTNGTLITTASGQTLTSPTITSPTITGAVMSAMASSVITSGTAVAYTSFTTTSYNDFTGIPNWVKRITIMGSGVVSSAGVIALRLGTSSGIVSTGYTAAGNNFTATATGGDNNTTYFYVRSAAFNGKMVLDLLSASTNTWTYQSISSEASGTTGLTLGAGVISLASTLTQVRFLSSTGTFSAGTINISYE